MKRTFCDRCGIETAEPAINLHITCKNVPERDALELCSACFAGFADWMKIPNNIVNMRKGKVK